MATPYSAINSAELQSAVLETLRKSAKPLHSLSIKKSLPKVFRVSELQVSEVLAQLTSLGSIHLWGKAGKRTVYSLTTPDQRARESLLQVLGEPASAKKIIAAARQRLTGLPAASKLLTKALPTLVEEGLARRHPKTGETFSRPPQNLPFEDAFAELIRRYSGISPAELRAAALRILGPESNLEDSIQQALLAVQPAARQGAVASLIDVRRHLTPPPAKADFDQAVMDLARRGVLSLHEFMGHLQIVDEEREQLVFDGIERYYGAVTFRR